MNNIAWRLKDFVTKNLLDSAARFKQENEDALPYKVIPLFKVVRNAPKAYYEQPVTVVRNCLESKDFLYSTNAEIMEIVAGRVAPYPLPASFMDKPLSPKQLKAIGSLMANAGLMFDPKAHKSLSKIKLVIQAGKAAADAVVRFTGSLSFGKGYVTVGTKRYPFNSDGNGLKRIKVGSQKLRVDVLQAMLEAGNLSSSTS